MKLFHIENLKTHEKKSIFTLSICILSLEIHILRLEICIFSLKIDF